MSEQDFKSIFLQGEDSLKEFKREEVHNESLAKVAVAFSNFEGGDIWVGVEDDGSISGVSQPKLEEKIVQICRNNISPSILPKIQSHTIEGKKVLQVTIEKGSSKPYKTQGKYFIRAGSLSVEPTNEELVRLFQEGELFHFEVKSIYGTSLDDIDRVKLDVYLREHRQLEFDENELHQLLQNLKIMDGQGNLTIVGLLFFGKNPAKYLPQSGIDMALFEGNDKTSEILDRKTMAEDVPSNIRAAMNFVKFNSRIQYYFPSEELQRIEVADYEPFAVRELLANAFQHRDWTIFGQQITLYMFKDRLELFSPGRLPNTMNLANALSGISYRRNPITAQILRDFDITEHVGRGLNKVMQFYKKKNYKLPEFEAGLHHFKVTLYKANPIQVE